MNQQELKTCYCIITKILTALLKAMQENVGMSKCLVESWKLFVQAKLD